MANQQPETESDPPKVHSHNWTFAVAFGTIFLLAAALITSTAWESYAPAWAAETLENKAQFLAVAAAMTFLLAFLRAWDPTGIARYATLSGGVLSFAAATFSIEIEQLHTGLPLMWLASPVVIISWPMLRWPENKSDWITVISTTVFIALIFVTLVLGVEPLTEVAATSLSIRDASSLFGIAIITGIGFTTLVITLRRCIEHICQTKTCKRFWQKVPKIRWSGKPPSRGERRRRERGEK